MNRNASTFSDVLDRIVAAKRIEVERLRPQTPALRAAAEAAPPPPDFEAALRAGPHVAVISEVKRRSPSAGAIRGDADAVTVARAYADAGAAAISVLTDESHFGGRLADLEAVGAAVATPLLRKDFTLDAAQVYEARAAGAAAVLLIVRILDDAALRDLHALTRELGMAALVEVHDEHEVDRALAADVAIIGINNRDLAEFTTDLAVTERLAPRIGPGRVIIGESGIRTPADVERLAAAGAGAVLVGESLMRADDPPALLRRLAAVPRAS